MANDELTVWMNGKFIPEHEARISILDDGFTRGDAVFDSARTFGGKAFQLEEHLDRFFNSCHALDLKPSLNKSQFVARANELVEKNKGLIGKNGDCWVSFRVTRGAHDVSTTIGHTGPTTIIVMNPIPFKARAPFYKEGIPIATPSVRRTPPWAFSPRIKSHNYLNFVAGELEVKKNNPKAWTVLLDEHGNLAEGNNSNIFLVREGRLFTPREQFVLPGISRANVIRLAREMGMTVTETDLDLHDLYLADEVFLTSTSLCMCGVQSANGRPIRQGAFGPVTTKLIGAYSKFIGLDFREQYLSLL